MEPFTIEIDEISIIGVYRHKINVIKLQESCELINTFLNRCSEYIDNQPNRYTSNNLRKFLFTNGKYDEAYLTQPKCIYHDSLDDFFADIRYSSINPNMKNVLERL
jgi:hypothetical protein